MTLHKQRYRAAWRWHFFAGVFVVPFLLVLAVTGLIMIYYTAVETPLGERLEVIAETQSTATAPTQQMDAATRALSGAVVTQYIPPRDAVSSVQFELIKDGNVHVVDLNPYTNQVLRVVDKNDTPYALAYRIHGSLLLGDTGDVILEIVAGLTILLLVTGGYLWWQQRKNPPAQPTVRRGRWRRWHLLTGLYTSLGLCFFLLSGLAWTNIWGGQLVQAWSSFPSEKWGPVSLSGTNHSAMNHGVAKEVPWGLEQTPLPASHSHSAHSKPTTQTSLNLDTVNALAHSLGLGPRYHINLPQDANGVYTISSTSMTGDIDVPGQERTVHIDQHSGEVVAEAGFADYSLMAKSMAVGIAVHQANMGNWNIVLNVAACLAVIFLCVSGTVMWWLRRPRQNRWLPAAPKTSGLPLRSSLTVLLVLLGVAFPLLGAVLIGGLLVYFLNRARQA